MNKERIQKRLDSLLEMASADRCDVYELTNGTLSMSVLIYGASSPQVKQIGKVFDRIERENSLQGFSEYQYFCHGVLQNMKTELQEDLIENIRTVVSGEILSDFLKLARQALEEKTEATKKVAAVLSAALFEDTIRRLATLNEIKHKEKLADVLDELKTSKILKGAQVGIAQSYLNFRNNALHADWDKVDRPEIQSVLAFTEELLLKHFS